MRRTFRTGECSVGCLMLGVTVSANAATLTGSFDLGSNLDVSVTSNSINWGGANNVNFNSATGDFMFLTGTDATLGDLMFPPDAVGIPISHSMFLSGRSNPRRLGFHADDDQQRVRKRRRVHE